MKYYDNETVEKLLSKGKEQEKELKLQLENKRKFEENKEELNKLNQRLKDLENELNPSFWNWIKFWRK